MLHRSRLRILVAAPGIWALAACDRPPTTARPVLPELIAFQSSQADAAGSDLYVSDPDGSNPVQLTQGVSVFAPEWSPDGRRIAFGSGPAGDQNIYVVDADGSNLRRLTETGRSNHFPTWSPDGEWIAFSSLAEGPGIYLARADGTGSRKLRACDCTRPAWSPDGRQIAFVDWSGAEAGEPRPKVYVMKADGSDAVALATGLRDERDPAWSPDSRRIAFAGAGSETGARHDIYVVDRDGSGLRRLADRPGWDWAPAFSRDGSRVVFEGAEERSSNLYVVGADGAGLVRITRFPGTHRQPTWRP